MAVKKSTKPAVDKAVEEKKPVATVKKVAKTVKDETVKAAETVKKETAKAAETVKKETAKATEAVKKETAKATGTVKKEAAKATEAVKAEVAEKKETVKKATKKAAEKKPAKKTAEAVNVAVQFDGKSYTTEELVKIAKDVWKYDLKKKATEFKTVDLYVKPEEALCYYVINGEVAGCFAI